MFSWAEKEIRAIPPRMLPAGAAILAISPLIDERTVGAIGDLRRRRLDIRVIEVSPSALDTGAGVGHGSAGLAAVGDAAPGPA